jgi:hypothetical protein
MAHNVVLCTVHASIGSIHNGESINMRVVINKRAISHLPRHKEEGENRRKREGTTINERQMEAL